MTGQPKFWIVEMLPFVFRFALPLLQGERFVVDGNKKRQPPTLFLLIDTHDKRGKKFVYEICIRNIIACNIPSRFFQRLEHKPPPIACSTEVLQPSFLEPDMSARKPLSERPDRCSPCPCYGYRLPF